jgi:hypothetical protein
MLQLIVPVAALGAVLWYFGTWPFDRNYRYLPRYTDLGNKKIDAPTPPKT